jgi:DNA mismatch endonuclease, patch repair protein
MRVPNSGAREGSGQNVSGSPWVYQSKEFAKGRKCQRLNAVASGRAGASVVDSLTKSERSKQMALIRSKNTKPELLVRRIARSNGYSFRQHVANLPGRPDLVFPALRKIIFVHGCFWHGHDCKLGRLPKSRKAYWVGKINGNRTRDNTTLRRLRGMRWRCLVLWECQLRDGDRLVAQIVRFLAK